jgi:hypothetical protein
MACPPSSDWLSGPDQAEATADLALIWIRSGSENQGMSGEIGEAKSRPCPARFGVITPDSAPCSRFQQLRQKGEIALRLAAQRCTSGGPRHGQASRNDNRIAPFGLADTTSMRLVIACERLIRGDA